MKNKLYLWGCFLILGLGLTSFSYAFQKIKAKENESASAFIAQSGLTRIAILHDRIQEVRGPQNRYQIQTDLQQGAIFLKPFPDTQNKPFTIFIATEQHHNYVLTLTSSVSPADTILIEPKQTTSAILKKHTPLPSSYLEALTQLITAMVNQTLPDGYQLFHPSQLQKEVKPFFTLTQIQIFRGKGLEGEVYQLKNRTKHKLYLNESQFYQQGDLAIALSSNNLLPHGQLWLFKVKHHEPTTASD